MALVSLPSPIVWPGICGQIGNAPAFGTASTLTSAGHYQAYIFSAKEDMAITHVSFRAGTSAGSPTITVSIEDLDATGFPTGTPAFGSSAGTTGTVSSNTNVLQALGATATITKGTLFCVKIALATGTSQIIQQLGTYSAAAMANYLIPYQVINTGTPTKSGPGQNYACVALGSSSTTFYNVPGTIGISAATAGTFNNTNSAKRGLRFTPPMNCRAIGIKWYNANATGNLNAVLYDDAGSELSSSSTAIDGDYSGGGSGGCYNVYFDNTVTLTAGTTYRVAIEPSSATNVNVSTLTLVSANYRGSSPAGTTAHYTTFATATWTDTATDQIPLMDVIIDQVDNGSGSGGVVGVIGG